MSRIQALYAVPGSTWRDDTRLFRCEHNVIDAETIQYRRRVTPGDLRCTCTASIKLDGVALCGKHAGAAALRILKEMPAIPAGAAAGDKNA